MSANTSRPLTSARPLRDVGTSFTMIGVLDGARVGASYAHGQLACDAPLRAVAELLVDLTERFEDPGSPDLVATIEGDPLAMLLTLMRACDRIVSIDVVLV